MFKIETIHSLFPMFIYLLKQQKSAKKSLEKESVSELVVMHYKRGL